MVLIRAVLNILHGEPEEWLNYHLGQQLHNDPHFARAKKKFSGLLFRLLILAHFVLRSSGWKIRPARKQLQGADYIVFANTINQIASLETTIESLRARNQKVLAITDRSLMGVRGVGKHYQSFSFGLFVNGAALAVLLCRFWPLRKRLLAIHPVAVDCYLNSFLEVYWYLSYFHSLLNESQAKFVITSNDHNTANRCLMAVASHLGVKTVYLQHASVSELFPALRFDYAFLDGESALDVYRQCENNQPESRRPAPIPEIFLSGQKKRVLAGSQHARRGVGLALNALDDVSAAISLVQHLLDEGFHVCLRWHPGHPKIDVDRLSATFSNQSHVSLSDPSIEGVAEFMGGISHLIAGNSSIHLEAVLSGVSSIYFELTPMDNPDYYGYVQSGIVSHALDVGDVVRTLKSDTSHHHPQHVNAVRYYSETFGTPWQGREGELVADTLIGIASGRHDDGVFGRTSFYRSQGVVDDATVRVCQ